MPAREDAVLEISLLTLQALLITQAPSGREEEWMDFTCAGRFARGAMFLGEPTGHTLLTVQHVSVSGSGLR